MPGNTFGKHFRILTFGESHGPAVGVVIDGVKPGLRFDERFIQKELDRRRPGQSSVTTSRNEEDRLNVLSGVFEGKTTGTPICLLVWNKNQQSKDYNKLKNIFRPGHAGYTYLAKFGIVDHRGGGRSSGRETLARVAAGAFARQLLERKGIGVYAHTKQVGHVRAKTFDVKQIEKNPLRCADPVAAKKMERLVLRVKKEGDSIGGIVEILVRNVPPGLGEPVFDKLGADFAKALMSIGTVRGVEVGNGFRVAVLRGSQNNDPLYYDKKRKRIRSRTNYAGGIVGGISSGEEIVLRIAVKAPSSIEKEQSTVDAGGRRVKISVKGRHDPCICPRVVPVAESMVALVLMDHLRRQRRIGRARERY